jgi:hypothetical protein
MCQNLYHRIHNILAKYAEITCGHSTTRKCNNGNNSNNGRKGFGQPLYILIDTEIIYYITELALLRTLENSKYNPCFYAVGQYE